MKKIRRAALMVLAMLMALLPVCAAAEPVNYVTLTLENIVAPSLGMEAGEGYSARIELGADTMRTLLNAAVIKEGEEMTSVQTTVEDSLFRMRLSSLKEDVVLPGTDAVVWLLGGDYLPTGYSKEIRRAADGLYDELSKGVSFGALNVEDFLCDEAEWRAYYEECAGREELVYEGEEQVELFGRIYTARKYVYDTGRIGWMEYLETEIPEGENVLLQGVNRGLYDALNELWALRKEGPMEQKNIIANEYTLTGTLYLIDEVMGVVETGTVIAHMNDGDQTETTERAEMFANGGVRIEKRFLNPEEGITTEEELHIDRTAGGVSLWNRFDRYDSGVGEEGGFFLTVTGRENTLRFDEEELTVGHTQRVQASGGYLSEQGFFMDLKADEEGKPSASGVISCYSRGGEQEFDFSADLSAEFAAMPEGELLPDSAGEIDLRRADDAEKRRVRRALNEVFDYGARKSTLLDLIEEYIDLF